MGRPLDVYFRLEDNDASSLSPAQANAYLAEDRLLGFEIVAREGARWVLHYNHAAQAYTDVPASIGVLVRQRRRWQNGSLFAQLLAMSQWARLLVTRHHPVRKLGFAVLFVYHALSTVLSFVLLGNAYVAYSALFRVLGASIAGSSPDAATVVQSAFSVLMWLFQLCLATMFVFSLGNRPEESETVWSICVHVLGAFNATSLALLIFMIRDFSSNWALWTGLLGALMAVFVCAIIQRRLGNIAISALQYLWMTPLYM